MSVDEVHTAPRRRDAGSTRRLLLAAAQRRFSADGYAATTVRSIADDAGVNAALISRYFASKEGLFEACLTGAAVELENSLQKEATLGDVADRIVHQIAGAASLDRPNQLLLLMRSSGDEHAEAIRARTLRTFAERLALLAGGEMDDEDRDRRLLAAQVVVAAGFGITIMRSWSAVSPLATAGPDELLPPVRALLEALLGPVPDRHRQAEAVPPGA
jgi:AcrR family transcriptional regulator